MAIDGGAEYAAAVLSRRITVKHTISNPAIRIDSRRQLLAAVTIFRREIISAAFRLKCRLDIRRKGALPMRRRRKSYKWPTG